MRRVIDHVTTALDSQPPTPDLLKRKPYSRNAPLVSKIMMRNIIGVYMWADGE